MKTIEEIRDLMVGIHTIGDVANTDPEYLRRWFGVNGLALWRYANGTDTSRVMHKDFVSPVKSVGHGITCVSDLEDEEEVWKVILALSQDVGHRLRVSLDVTLKANHLFMRYLRTTYIHHNHRATKKFESIANQAPICIQLCNIF